MVRGALSNWKISHQSVFKDLITYALEKEIIWSLTCSGFCTMYLLMVVCGYVVTFTVGEWSSCSAFCVMWRVLGAQVDIFRVGE